MTDTSTQTTIDTNSSFYDIAKPIVAGQVRHVLSGIGAALVAKGALDPGVLGQFVEMFSGFAIYLLGAGWSWWQKIGQARLLADVSRFRT
jgi:hypothetical protein